MRLFFASFVFISLACVSQLPAQDVDVRARVQQYAPVKLTADLSHLSDNQKQIVKLLIRAARQMDDVFWMQAYGDKQKLLDSAPDRPTRRFLTINYGPWDRLGNNRPFLTGVKQKPPGANFYPRDMTKEEFEKHVADNPDDLNAFRSLYTLIERNDQGKLVTKPYHVAFASQHRAAAELLKRAATLAEDEGFKKYLEARAAALLNDEYQPSDMLWMDMKNNAIDVVIGPIENYEDQLFGYKAAHECYVLIKDQQWSQRLSKYANMLEELQQGLPVDKKYKSESPGANSDLNAYDVVYYAGDCNAGAKTIAINLPNDEEVQLKKGTRRLQLKNAMKAKFEKIVVPISKTLIVEDQRKHVTFNGFFSNTMFHEVAHGLGIKYTINTKVTVREALKETYSSIEEGKADILGLYMVTQLFEKGEISEGSLEDYYVTFMASVFRSVRFGASSAHGRANMIRFNYFREAGAFTREESGLYRINMDKMRQAMTSLSARLLTLQGNGDYDVTSRFVKEVGQIGPELQADLERLNAAGIPVDIVFQQGVATLGL